MPPTARERAGDLLGRLNVPGGCGTCRRRRSPAASSSVSTSPAALRRERPILLLDEPTASLDAANRAVVVDLIESPQARRRGAILGIFHDDDVRDRIADRVVDVTRFAPGGLTL